jgi:hypothetical protein
MTRRRLVLLLQAGKPPRQEKPILMTKTTKMVVAGDGNVRKVSPAPLTETTPIRMKTKVKTKVELAEGKSAETRKEKSFPVPEKVAVKTPILMTRTVTR